MMHKNEWIIVKGFLNGLKPEEILTVSEWADKHRYLSPESSAEPGPWRTLRTPYLRAIMDVLSSHDPAQIIVFMKGHQIGGSEAGFNWLGYIIDNSPGPTLLVMPTVSTMERNSKTRIAPMIEATPRLRDKIKPVKTKDSGNTIFQKSFPGGTLIMSGANSASSLRSMPMRNLFLDEVDEYPEDVDGQGSPIELARKRTSTFSKKKVFIVSTPTIEGASAVEREFELTDKRYYYVPCPHCNELQKLVWDHLHWDKGKPETVVYVCEYCAATIEEYHKTWMLDEENGAEWRSTSPEGKNARRVGFHMSSLYSPLGWYSWSQAVEDWEDAQKDVNKLKTFINTVLGETWKEKGEAPPWENIYNRRKQYKVNVPNNNVKMITAGVDVQKDRLEIEIVGWCADKITYSIDYRIIPGATDEKEVWDKLAIILTEQFKREDGVLLPILMMGVDSGYNTQFVYDFVRRHDPSRVFAVKGSDTLAVIIGSAKRVDVTMDGKQVGRATLYSVGVSILKSELYGWLKQEESEEGVAPYGFCYFPEYGPDFFKGLTGERLEFKMVRGYKKYEWVKHFERNEPLDCRVYARAAAALIGIDRFQPEHWAALEESYGVIADHKPKRKKGGSSFWG